MHIVIAGSDEVAVAITEQLMQRHEVVLLCGDRTAVPRLEWLDCEVVEGALTELRALTAARVARSHVFVACSDHDEANIIACLSAQRMGARRTICLLSRPGFTQLGGERESLARSLGIDAVVRPAEKLATEMLRIIRVPGALEVEHLWRGRVRVLRHVVEPGARLTRFPLKQAPLPRQVVLAMNRRGDDVFIPDGDTVFQAGDKVTVIGTPHGVEQMLFGWLRAEGHGDEAHRATIVGGGSVGFAVARGLEAAGWRVRVVEVDRSRCEAIAPQLGGLVIHGDGSEGDLLEREQVGLDPVLLAVTSNDEKNLLVSLVARALGVERIITRADRYANERLFERVGIDVVRSARGAAIRRVVHGVIEASSEVRAELEHGDVHIIELELPEDYPPVYLRDLRRPIFAIVGALMRGRQILIPDGRTRLRGGDHLLILCSEVEERATRHHFLRPKPSRDQDDRDEVTQEV